MSCKKLLNADSFAQLNYLSATVETEKTFDCPKWPKNPEIGPHTFKPSLA